MPRLRSAFGLLLILGATLSGSALAGTTKISQAALCATGNLRVSQPDGGAAAGTAILTLAYQNTTRTTCVMSGYPGLTLYARDDRELAIAKRNGGHVQRVILAPEARAFSIVTYADDANSLSRCSTPRRIRIYPPDNRTPVWIPLREAEPYCPYGVLVHPVAATRAKALNDGGL